MPKISVIVPVYNVEQYVQHCIESIQNQTIKDIEIVIVNDCTPDNSMTIVDILAKQDGRIKIINHEKNMGLMWARRTGYIASSGEYIAFCDSDDYMPTSALAALYSAAKKDSTIDIVSGNITNITPGGSEHTFKNELKYGNDKLSTLKSLLRGELKHSMCGKLFKASVLKDYNYSTYEHFINGEDGCLLYQVVDNISKIVQIDEPVYYYMLNTQSSTHVRLKDNAIKSICILNRKRHEIASKYDILSEDLNKCVTRKLCDLYVQGYYKDTKLTEYIGIEGLKQYISISNIIKYCDVKVLFKLPLIHIITHK